MSLSTSRSKVQLAPAQQYEALANWVLNKRLWTLSLYTGFPVLISTTLLAMFTKSLFTFSALFAIPIFTILMCVTFILPLVTLRRWGIESISTPPTTNYARVSAVLKSLKGYQTIGIVSVSFAAFTISNGLCAAYLGAHNWHLFAPTKRHSSNLNENMLFLIVGNGIVGGVLGAIDLALKRAQVDWPAKITIRPHALFSGATDHFNAGARSVVSCLVVSFYSWVYWWARKGVYRGLMRLPLIGGFFKPFMIQAARPSTSLSIVTYLFPRLLILAIVTTIHYENVQAWFDSVCSRGMLLSSDSTDPDACLRSGLESPSEYYQHFAYMELAYIAHKGPAGRRAAIFHDPGKWNFISRACFKILGEDYGLLKRRGNPAPLPPTTPAPPPATPAQSQVLATPRKSNIANLGASVYKPLPPPSPGSLLMKSLLSASSTSPATSSSVTSSSPPGTAGSPGSEGIRSPIKNGAMPNIFVMQPREESSPSAAPAAPPLAAGGESVAALLKKWIGFAVSKLTARVPSLRKSDEPFIVVPPFLKTFNAWMEREKTHKVADGILRRRYLDRSCVQVLIGFTIASLAEDAYGTLQQDIPRVLEVLTKELIALEDYDAELVTGIDEGKKDQWEVREAQAMVLNPLANDITSGLREIIATFGDRLNVFRLPLPVARKLQLIADTM